MSVTITPMEPGWYGVQLEEGDLATSHRVHVPDALLQDLGLTGVDHELIISETFAFLVEREPPSSILGEFSLEVVPRYFPEFYDELRSRVARRA